MIGNFTRSYYAALPLNYNLGENIGEELVLGGNLQSIGIKGNYKDGAKSGYFYA